MWTTNKAKQGILFDTLLKQIRIELMLSYTQVFLMVGQDRVKMLAMGLMTDVILQNQGAK